MPNREKLRDLFLDVFLLNPDEFRFDLRRDQIETWDSLGVVSLAVGVHETFGYHLTPQEATSIDSVQALIDLLSRNGVSFDDAA
jgi:acyl carrier protein